MPWLSSLYFDIEIQNTLLSVGSLGPRIQVLPLSTVWRCSGLMVSACPNVQALARDIVMCSYSASLNPGVQMHAWLWVMGHGLCLKIM